MNKIQGITRTTIKKIPTTTESIVEMVCITIIILAFIIGLAYVMSPTNFSISLVTDNTTKECLQLISNMTRSV